MDKKTEQTMIEHVCKNTGKTLEEWIVLANGKKCHPTQKKQFCCLKPATKTRFEIELILKGQEPQGVLEAITGAGAMCTQ